MQNIGILDVKGENINPLTNEKYSDEYKKLAKIWSKFPAYEKVEEIIENIKNNQVILVISGTGSGKTVLIPKFALHVLEYNKNIAITLPKQIIAKSAAEFASKTLDVKIGEEVGYQYKGESKKSNKTKLLYATDGTIVSRLLKDPLLKDFDCVIIDEAHERKVQIDFLLYLLKNTVRLRPEFKLIIMSATVNEEIFKAYFIEEKFTIVDVGAKTNYPIESIFLKEPINQKEFLNTGFKILKNIIKNDNLDDDSSHDILFFITSVTEANKICEKINKDPELVNDNMCIEVYAGMDSQKQELAQDKDLYKEKFKKKRKIVLATNVAESSLTIDGIKYVIDSGLELSGYFDPILNCKILEKKLITHAQAKQRMGRAGRTESGICYHLYLKEDFDKNMERFPEPTIRVSNITNEALKFLSIPEINSFTKLLDIFSKFIEPPKELYIRYAYNELLKLKLLKDDKITELGILINDLGLEPRFGIACIIGKKLRCLNEITSICACLEAGKNNINEFFNYPSDIVKIDETSSDDEKTSQRNRMKTLNDKFNKQTKKFHTKFGDLTSILKIFIEIYERYNKDGHHFGEKSFDICYKYFLNPSVWIKACTYYDKYLMKFRHILKNINEISEINDIEMALKINSCFYFAFKDNYVELYDEKMYKNKRLNILNINLNEDSFNYDKKHLPKELYYIQLIKNMGKFEISITSQINEPTKKLFSIINKHI